MHSPRILVLADDLTGALEAGAAFANHGLQARITFSGDPVRGDEDVVVVDTETRHSSPDAAALKISDLARTYVAAFLGASRQSAPLIYKKTDSTLRGHIRAELTALCEFGPILYVPAHPRAGRTLKNGCIHVDGVPLQESAFAHDPLDPICDSSVVNLIGGENRICISEANTEHSLREVACEWLKRGGTAAGPAGLLQAAAELMNPKRLTIPRPSLERAAVVIGSLHPRSREQATEAQALFSDAGWRLIQSPDPTGQDPRQFASSFAARAWTELRDRQLDTLVVFGGDTAYWLIRAMGVDHIVPVGEIFDGVPVSRLPSGMNLITKAGGFGPSDLLVQLYRKCANVPI